MVIDLIELIKKFYRFGEPDMMPVTTTIHFLAHTLTGKTCLTAGMYAKFKLRPSGFRLYAVDAKHKPDDDRDLDLTETWDAIAEGIYPERTTEEAMTTYHFELQHDTMPFIRFDWLDYRGGVVSARKSAGDYGQFRTQLDKVQTNGCLFIGISAELLLKPIENDEELLAEVRKKAWVDRIDQLTKDAAASTPAVIIITKSDFAEYKRRSPEGVVSDLKRLFPDWFKPGNKRLTMICPVSVVNGKNLEYPLIFAAWATLMREHAAAQQSLSSASSSYTSKYDGGFWADVAYGWSKTFGDGQYKREVDNLYESRNSAQSRVNALEERLKPLSAALTSMITFKDGKEMTDREKRGIYSFDWM